MGLLCLILIKVARVAFTGGCEVAKQIVKNTAENFAYLSLELGGKSPIVVFDDCDLEGAVNGIIAGNFGASGQSCVAGSRVFIQKNIYSKVLKKIKERAEKIIIGDPLDDKTQVGPLATKLKWNVQKKSLWNLQQGIYPTGCRVSFWWQAT